MAGRLAIGHRLWPWFAGWVAVGAAWSLAGVAVLSVGLLVVPAAVVGTVVLARKGPPGSSRFGVVTGLGLVPLYVAYLNRAGPGTVCSAIAHGGHSCLQAWNPWPWVAAGTALVALGIALFVALCHRYPSSSPSPWGS